MSGSKTKIFLVTYFVFDFQHFKELANLPPQHLSYWFLNTDQSKISLQQWEDSWHTFHVIIFHIFLHLKLDVTACKYSHTVGLLSDVHKFEGVRKEKKGKAFSLASACVPTCPADGVSLHMVRIYAKSS